MRVVKTLLAVVVAAAAAAVPSLQAAPLPTHLAAMKRAEGTDILQVRWIGWRGGWGPGFGYRPWGWGVGALAAGALIGGAIASSAYYGPYPPYGYGYGGGYAYGGCDPYGGCYPYAGYAPVYYGPPYYYPY